MATVIKQSKKLTAVNSAYELDAKTIKKVLEGWKLKRLLEDTKEKLEAINAELLKEHGPGCTLVVAGVCRVSLSERQITKIADPYRLREILKERMHDLVREEVTYKAEPKLVEMASNADDPLQPAISGCLEVSKVETVSWRPER